MTHAGVPLLHTRGGTSVLLCPLPSQEGQGTCGHLVFPFLSWKNLQHACYFPVTLLAGTLTVGAGLNGWEPLGSAGPRAQGPLSWCCSLGGSPQLPSSACVPIGLGLLFISSACTLLIPSLMWFMGFMG